MPPQDILSPQSSNKKVILLVVLFVILLVVAFLMQPGKKKEQANENTKENVLLTRVDLTTATGENKLPSGFPEDIPIETVGITNSYKAVFPDRGITGRGITEYTVSFISSKSKGEVYDMYEKFMVDSGYKFLPENQSKEKGILYGRNDSGDLSVFISEENSKTAVGVTLLKQN